MLRAIAAHPRGQWPEDGMVDKVTLAYLDRHRRRIRLVADSGAAFLLDLPRPQHLADGDGLELDSGGYVKVCGAPVCAFARITSLPRWCQGSAVRSLAARRPSIPNSAPMQRVPRIPITPMMTTAAK